MIFALQARVINCELPLSDEEIHITKLSAIGLNSDRGRGGVGGSQYDVIHVRTIHFYKRMLIVPCSCLGCYCFCLHSLVKLLQSLQSRNKFAAIVSLPNHRMQLPEL